MKELISKEFDLGSDAEGKALLGIEGEHLKMQVTAQYPVVKIIEPATKAVDNLLDKLERAIPGNWDKPLIEKVKQEYKEELLKLLSE